MSSPSDAMPTSRSTPGIAGYMLTTAIVGDTKTLPIAAKAFEFCNLSSSDVTISYKPSEDGPVLQTYIPAKSARVIVMALWRLMTTGSPGDIASGMGTTYLCTAITQ